MRIALCTIAVAVSSAFATVGVANAQFGLRDFSYKANNMDGTPATQAGSHPGELTTAFDLNQATNGAGEPIPDGDARDVEVKPPLGLTGDPRAAPTCSIERFTTPLTPAEKAALPENSNLEFSGASCPDDSQIGVADLRLPGEHFIGVYNLAPPPGVPAEFGFNYIGSPVILTAALRADGSYGLAVDAEAVTQAVTVDGVTVTLWGVPAAASHDDLRGECLSEGGHAIPVPGGCPSGIALRPFLTLPTSCPAEPPVMSISADPWQEPGSFITASAVNHDSHGNPVGISGCAHLDFSPSLSLTPDTSAANAPAGLGADLQVPQNEDPNGLAESHLRTASVTLPPGMVVNPSAAEGRVACTPAQVELNAQTAAACPDASKLGSVIASTPLLEKPLTGSVYLAAQENNPFNSLLAIYLVAENEVEGVHVKLAGQIHADPNTGQLTATFDGNRLYGPGAPLEGEPQLPFNDLKLRFFGGPRAALMTPECGSYTPTALFTPWSGTQPVAPAIAPFTVSSGCGTGFAPTLSSGTVNNQAGAYSPFVTTITRSDQDQQLGQVSVKLPAGALGMLSHVQLCPEPEAQAGACPVASQVGHLDATAGAGPDPVSLPQAGKREDPVFLTGPYQGGPFGLSILVHAEAGPFNLGDLVIRAGIHVNPQTAQITVVTDPLPRILRGIPLDVRSASVTIDRAGAAADAFTFNPTNCEPLSVAGTVASTNGAPAPVSNRFQAANCATLPFKPTFKATTVGRASKANGASLEVNVSSKGGPQPGGGEANIRSVRVELPKQLPSRLSTLQKACVAAVFEANPAGCPTESRVGYATANTPVLSHPLTGPAYLVSHGGAAFPDLEVVLQGEGIQLILDGHTDIKHGVTSSTFETVPDAPISSFHLKLPTGRYSVLGVYVPANANYNLCGQKLNMPTVITGQNGAVMKQTTKIGVAGCPKAKAARAKKARSGRRKR